MTTPTVLAAAQAHAAARQTQFTDARRACLRAGLELKRQQEAHRLAKAQLESDLIAQCGGEKVLGSNQEARERALTLLLAEDATYRTILEALRAAEAEYRTAETALAIVLDMQRVEEELTRSVALQLRVLSLPAMEEVAV